MEFLVEVEEILRRVIKVKAQSAEEAENAVEEKYYSCDIILDADDFVGAPTIKSIGLLCDNPDEKYSDFEDYLE